jgi:hypothetical protein
MNKMKNEKNREPVWVASPGYSGYVCKDVPKTKPTEEAVRIGTPGADAYTTRETQPEGKVCRWVATPGWSGYVCEDDADHAKQAQAHVATPGYHGYVDRGEVPNCKIEA